MMVEQGWEKRTQLIERLKNFAYGEEEESHPSPVELFRHGFIPKACLLKQTVSLKYYLSSRKIPLWTEFQPQLFEPLSQLIPQGIIMVKVDSQVGTRVYPPFTDQVKDELNRLVYQIKNRQLDHRTEQEKEYYKEKLFRIKDQDNNLVPIVLEEAVMQFNQRVRLFLYRLTKGNDVLIGDITSSVSERLLPILLGEKGDFDNFDKFISYALTAAKREFVHQLKESRETVSLDENQIYFPKEAVSSDFDLQIEDKFGQLTPLEQAVIRLYGLGIRPQVIAEIVEKEHTKSAVTHIFNRSLDKIFPQRPKKKAPTGFIDHYIALMDYKRLREKNLSHKNSLPSSKDLERAFENKELRFSPSAYLYHFGHGSWKMAQRELESLLDVPKIQFLSDPVQIVNRAVEKGIHLQNPKKTISDQIWQRDVNITRMFAESSASSIEIGEMFGGMTRANVMRIVHMVIRHFLKQNSSEIEQKFSLKSLNFKKPTSQRTREKESLSQGGVSYRVAQLIKEGQGMDRIRQEGLSLQQIREIRLTLRGWGIDISHLQDKEIIEV